MFVGISAPKHMIFKQDFPKGTIHWNDGLDIYCFLILCDKHHINLNSPVLLGIYSDILFNFYMVDAIIQYFKKNTFVIMQNMGSRWILKKTHQ